MLTDDYIKRRIVYSDSDKRYGKDTYFGRKFFYKTSSGALIVATIPFLTDAQDTLDIDDISLYPQLGMACDLLDLARLIAALRKLRLAARFGACAGSDSAAHRRESAATTRAGVDEAMTANRKRYDTAEKRWAGVGLYYDYVSDRRLPMPLSAATAGQDSWSSTPLPAGEHRFLAPRSPTDLSVSA